PDRGIPFRDGNRLGASRLAGCASRDAAEGVAESAVRLPRGVHDHAVELLAVAKPALRPGHAHGADPLVKGHPVTAPAVATEANGIDPRRAEVAISQARHVGLAGEGHGARPP